MSVMTAVAVIPALSKNVLALAQKAAAVSLLLIRELLRVGKAGVVIDGMVQIDVAA